MVGGGVQRERGGREGLWRGVKRAREGLEGEVQCGERFWREGLEGGVWRERFGGRGLEREFGERDFGGRGLEGGFWRKRRGYCVTYQVRGH